MFSKRTTWNLTGNAWAGLAAHKREPAQRCWT